MRRSLIAIGFAALFVGGCQSGNVPPDSNRQSPEISRIQSPQGGCLESIEDFENFVSGGKECLAIKTFRSKKNFQSPPTLVVSLHGDGNRGPAADKAPKVTIDQIQDQIAGTREFAESNSIIIVIARLGYPIPSTGRSTGHRPEPATRRGTYKPQYIQPVFQAIQRLAEHYGAKRIVGWGSSGGSATLAVGAGLFQEIQFSDLLLGVCPCNVPAWEAKHGWSSSGAYSPLDYAAKIPASTNVVLVVGKRDSNTPPLYSEQFAGVREKIGHQVRSVYTNGTHGGTKRTLEHVQEQIKTLGDF